MAKRTSIGKIAAALGIALSGGAVVTGAMAVTSHHAEVPSVEQHQVAATTDPSDPVGLCRITKACSQ